MPRCFSASLARLLSCTALVAASGCYWHLNDPGTNAPVNQFYFPTGIAMDPAGRYIYVANGNADLRYAGGLLQMVDTHRFDCAVGRYCDQTRLCNRPLDSECSDSDIAQADIDLKYQPTPGEAECQPDPLDPGVVDCDEGPFIVPNAVVRLGNFAGDITLATRPIGQVPSALPSPEPLNGSDGSQERRLFIGVRGDPSVTYVDAHLGNLLPLATPRPGVLDCFDNPASLMARPGYDAVTNTTTAAPECDSDHLVQTYECADDPLCEQEDENLPPEPFGMYLDTGLVPSTGQPYGNLLVSHLSSGQVSLIDALFTPPLVKTISGPFLPASPTGQHGTFALAPMFPHQLSSIWYMTSNIQPLLATFRVAEANVIVPSTVVSLGSAFAQGSDIRAINFEPGGQRAFLTINSPPSIGVLDTALSTTQVSPGQVVNQLTDAVGICTEPSHMGVRRTSVVGAAGTPPRLKTELFAVCFSADQIQIVDPDLVTVEDTVLTGRGPNAIVFNYSDFDEPAATALPTPVHQRAWFTQYAEMTVGEIDLDPGSPTFHRQVARIGKPVPPPTLSQ